MNVRVTILISNPPSPQKIDSLKAAALNLTNDKSSINVTTNQTANHHTLITDFTMRTTAQYKVVGDIDKAFKFQTWDFEDYQDMTIQFPK
ncbi:hypothetical protein Lepto7375DRAFT_7172 [Leptolyngbya sp. PCC 7375]|nr:hypothetical protein Lepto7375DRAFT_7172 [Leptolyngbya sp. PCC 7375]